MYRKLFEFLLIIRVQKRAMMRSWKNLKGREKDTEGDANDGIYDNSSASNTLIILLE